MTAGDITGFSNAMKILRTTAQVIVVLFSIAVLLFVLDFIHGVVLTDDWYREGMDESGDEKAVIYSLRDFYHGKTSYPTLTLDDLHRRKIISDGSYDFITSHWYYSYTPFSPSTPDRAVVLTFGIPGFGEVLHKGDFTAGPNDGDIVIQ